MDTSFLNKEFRSTLAQLICEISTDTIVLLDGQLKIIFLNPAAEKLLNCPVKDAHGKQFSEFFNNWTFPA